MKTLILAALIITLGLASCTVTQPNDSDYYPQQRVYTNPNYLYDPYYDRYATRRVYDHNTGRYYDVPVYNSPYSTPYDNRTYRRDNYRRDNARREYRDQPNYEHPRTYQQPTYQQPRVEQPREKKLPDGSIIYPDGSVRLPNGQIRSKQ